MSIKTQINEDLKKAMREKQKTRLRSLRAIKSALIEAAAEKGAGGEVSEEKELKILKKLAKNHKESIEVYEKEGRDDLLKEEKEELEIIEEYLPEQLSENEIREKVKTVIDEVGAESMEDMGKVMGKVMDDVGAQADGSTVSSIVKEMLS